MIKALPGLQIPRKDGYLSPSCHKKRPAKPSRGCSWNGMCRVISAGEELKITQSRSARISAGMGTPHPFHEEIPADSNQPEAVPSHPGVKIPSPLLPGSCGEEEEGGITLPLCSWNLLLVGLGDLSHPQRLWDSPDQVPQR